MGAWGWGGIFELGEVNAHGVCASTTNKHIIRRSVRLTSTYLIFFLYFLWLKVNVGGMMTAGHTGSLVSSLN